MQTMDFGLRMCNVVPEVELQYITDPKLGGMGNHPLPNLPIASSGVALVQRHPNIYMYIQMYVNINYDRQQR